MEDTLETNKWEKYFELMSLPTISLKDSAPEELKHFVYQVHEAFDSLPNDWIYCEIYNAFNKLANDSIDDINIEADAYHSDLYKWLGEPFASSCIEDYMSDFSAKTTDIYEMIASGQWVAKNRIYQMVNDFINEGEE